MKRKQNTKNEKGMATVETVLLLFLFVLFMGFATGFYGVIHVGILNSISARAYAFEVLSNRSNVTYHRNPADVVENMKPYGFRVHAIVMPTQGDDWTTQKVPIAFGIEGVEETYSTTRPIKATEGVPMARSKANPVWIKTAYGICVDAKCGG